ncbi:uncharacterized protein LOC131850161 [Achroia grisella]|uniref:uncharacterized protein LOC131850161 n=1 Tax=Achroia grisella TaxID=688607 RepID=UPI0027D23891|nr:uncharacterized protein LOC131850161 [Achroia grisella]
MGSKQENTSISLQMAIELINHIDFQVERKYYYEALNRRSNLKTSMLTQIDAPWSRTSYNGLIEAIEKCLTWEKQKEKATQPTEFDFKVHSFYDVLYENGVKTLILKEKSKDNSLIKINY